MRLTMTRLLRTCSVNFMDTRSFSRSTLPIYTIPLKAVILKTHLYFYHRLQFYHYYIYKNYFKILKIIKKKKKKKKIHRLK
jgi:hypothetical protein